MKNDQRKRTGDAALMAIFALTLIEATPRFIGLAAGPLGFLYGESAFYQAKGAGMTAALCLVVGWTSIHIIYWMTARNTDARQLALLALAFVICGVLWMLAIISGAVTGFTMPGAKGYGLACCIAGTILNFARLYFVNFETIQRARNQVRQR